MAENITYDIKERIGVLLKKADGWSREVNLVAWNGGEAKYDIRDWDTKTHTKMSRGITMTLSEMRRLVKLMEGRV